MNRLRNGVLAHSALRSAIRPIYRFIMRARDRRALAKVSRMQPCRVIVGAGGTTQEGWIATEGYALNLVKAQDWAALFEEGSIDAILAEHVWEHLSPNEGALAARICYSYLTPGGYLRIAVPDGLQPDPDYIRAVTPGSDGPGAWDHKVLYTYVTLGELLGSSGYDVTFLEYFDENGEFHTSEWDSQGGLIRRSKKYHPENRDGRLRYTSIIVDAVKPETPPVGSTVGDLRPTARHE